MNEPVPAAAGLLASLLAAALWLDYTVAAFQAHRRLHATAYNPAVHRVIILGLIGLFSVLLSAVTWIAEYSQPHPHDFILFLVSAHRAMMIIAGLWLAWDRRIHPQRF